MKKEYKMLQKEMNEILKINKEFFRPVIKIGNHWTGLGLQEEINSYWSKLSKKYKFIDRTVEASAKGGLYFLAKPITKKEIV